jgi:hypothetical protein
MGPYNCKCEAWKYQAREFREKHSSDFFLSTRPGMMEDILRPYPYKLEDWYSGFEDTDQMCKWFDIEELRQFHKAGFWCVVWSVLTNYCIGRSKNQVFFVREGQWLVRTRELPDCGRL